MRFILNELRKTAYSKLYSHLTVASAFERFCQRHQ